MSPPMAPQYQPTCENCHRGVLTPKKIYRMGSGTATVGRIFLIGSIIGAIASALLFFGMLVYNGGKWSSVAGSPSQEDIDNKFRRGCVDSAVQKFQQAGGTSAPLPAIEQLCECSLAEIKGTDYSETAVTAAAQACLQQRRDGTLAPLTQDQQDIYGNLMGDSGPSSDAAEQAAVERLAGILGAFFGAGLMGWLLILKKRVLQCVVCGATVEAS